MSIFGKGSYLNPNDTRQYLYKLKPKSPLEKNMKVCLITEEEKNTKWVMDHMFPDCMYLPYRLC